jgi:hypothetical protein
MFLNNSAKEALIGIVEWYNGVNGQGSVTIDDLARLKMFVDLSTEILNTNKELLNAEHEDADAGEISRVSLDKHGQVSFNFADRALYYFDDDIPF